MLDEAMYKPCCPYALNMPNLGSDKNRWWCQIICQDMHQAILQNIKKTKRTALKLHDLELDDFV